MERDSKLVSPEKVLSLRRNSAAGNGESGQPLSSLFNQSLNESLNGLDRSLSKGSRDFGAESRRFASESFHEERSSSRVLGSSFRELSNYSVSNNTTTERSDFSEAKRAVVDNASNVKGLFSTYLVILSSLRRQLSLIERTFSLRHHVHPHPA